MKHADNEHVSQCSTLFRWKMERLQAANPAIVPILFTTIGTTDYQHILK